MSSYFFLSYLYIMIGKLDVFINPFKSIKEETGEDFQISIKERINVFIIITIYLLIYTYFIHKKYYKFNLIVNFLVPIIIWIISFQNMYQDPNFFKKINKRKIFIIIKKLTLALGSGYFTYSMINGKINSTVPFVLMFINILEATALDFVSGDYANGISGIIVMMNQLIPTTTRWYIKENTLMSSTTNAFMWTYAIWNLKFMINNYAPFEMFLTLLIPHLIGMNDRRLWFLYRSELLGIFWVALLFIKKSYKKKLDLKKSYKRRLGKNFGYTKQSNIVSIPLLLINITLTYLSHKHII